MHETTWVGVKKSWLNWKMMRMRDTMVHSFLYKNLFYKNVEDEFCLELKNILRTLPRLRVG